MNLEKLISLYKTNENEFLKYIEEYVPADMKKLFYVTQDKYYLYEKSRDLLLEEMGIHICCNKKNEK